MRRLYLLSAIVFWGLACAFAQSGGELRFCLRSEPKTFNPLLVEDDAKDVELTMEALGDYNLSNEVVVASDGEEADVPYTAQYYFYRADPSAQ